MLVSTNIRHSQTHTRTHGRAKQTKTFVRTSDAAHIHRRRRLSWFCCFSVNNAHSYSYMVCRHRRSLSTAIQQNKIIENIKQRPILLYCRGYFIAYECADSGFCVPIIRFGGANFGGESSSPCPTHKTQNELNARTRCQCTDDPFEDDASVTTFILRKN